MQSLRRARRRSTLGDAWLAVLVLRCYRIADVGWLSLLCLAVDDDKSKQLQLPALGEFVTKPPEMESNWPRKRSSSCRLWYASLTPNAVRDLWITHSLSRFVRVQLHVFTERS